MKREGGKVNWDEAKPWDGMTHWWRRAKAAEAKLDQLRTDEAVERVARGIHDADCACGDLTSPQFEGQEGSEHYRELARAAITALIGES